MPIRYTPTSESEVYISWNEPEIGGGYYPVGEYLVKWKRSLAGVDVMETVKNKTHLHISGLFSNEKYFISVTPSQGNGTKLIGVESIPESAITGEKMTQNDKCFEI